MAQFRHIAEHDAVHNICSRCTWRLPRQPFVGAGDLGYLLAMKFILLITVITVAGAQALTPAEKAWLEKGCGQASIIVVGSIGASASGGGGTTSSIKVQHVLLDTTKEVVSGNIVVAWLTSKARESTLGKEYIWFLEYSSKGIFRDISRGPLLESTEEAMDFVKERVRQRTSSYN